MTPGNFEHPYSTQTEWLWVLKRTGDRLVNHDNSSRGDILRFSPVYMSSIAGTPSHAFEKPVSICQFLLGKHSFESDLVFDACACTGSMSVAAAGMNRRWVYCESHQKNFELGSARVAQATAKPILAAG